MDFDKVIDRRGTVSRKWDDMKAMFGREDLIPLWVADMDFAVPPAVVHAIRERASHPVYGYTFRSKAYTDAIIGWFNRRHRFSIDPEWIVYTPAIVTAISVAIQTFTEPGDEVIVQPPVYPPFYSCVKNNGRQILENPLRFEQGRYLMDLEDLAKKLSARTKLLILCSPNNPTGTVWHEDELKKLGTLCAERGIVILADEMHCDLVFRGSRHIPIATLSPEIAKWTVTMVSPAKTFNLAGFYNSTTVIPDSELRRKFYNAMDSLELSMGNLFGIVSAEAAYTHGDEWLDELLLYLAANAEYLTEAVRYALAPLKMENPESTYLAWLDCRGLGMTPDQLSDFFVNRARVGLNAGTAFGSQSAGFMRLNFGCARSTLEKGVERIRAAL